MNRAAADNIGLEMKEEYVKDAAEIFTEITAE